MIIKRLGLIAAVTLFSGALCRAGINCGSQVYSAADFSPRMGIMGSLNTIFCTGLVGIQGIQQASGFPLPAEIAGVRVTIEGISAPLLAVADLGTYQQINFQAPTSLTISATPVVPQWPIVVSQGSDSATILGGESNGPTFFQDANGFVIAQHTTDYSLITANHPAMRGEAIILYATGVDPLNYLPLGTPMPSLPSLPFQSGSEFSYTLVFGDYTIHPGVPSIMLYSGWAPGLVGVGQFNIRIPEDVGADNGTIKVGLSIIMKQGSFWLPTYTTIPGGTGKIYFGQ